VTLACRKCLHVKWAKKDMPAGLLRPAGPDGSARKPVWVWVAECEDAWTVADLLRPWLSTVRLEQLERVFRADV
jgi:hypothetical protein